MKIRTSDNDLAEFKGKDGGPVENSYGEVPTFTKVYIGAPIDTARPDCPPGEQMEELARSVLDACLGKAVIYNPLTAYCNAGMVDDVAGFEYIIDLNFEALRKAEIGIFVWNGSSSYGVPIEIEFCYQNEKPFVVWNKTAFRLGLYLRHRARAGRGMIVQTEEELRDALAILMEREKYL